MLSQLGLVLFGFFVFFLEHLAALIERLEILDVGWECASEGKSKM